MKRSYTSDPPKKKEPTSTKNSHTLGCISPSERHKLCGLFINKAKIRGFMLLLTTH